MGKPIIGILIGDTHVLGDTGLCIPDYRMSSKEDRPYQASAAQRFLYTSFIDFVSYAKMKSRGHRVFVGLGGDIVDGVMHHNTTQTAGVDDDQIAMAVKLLLPVVNMADAALGVTGTDAHVGDMGDADRTICRELGVKISASWKVDIGPRRLWWAHHGVAIGMREHTLENGAQSLVKDIEARCLRNHERVPDAIIAHHRHKTFIPFELRGIRAALCPCWQFPTNHGAKHPFTEVDIGALIWDVTSNVIERKLYGRPQAIKHIFEGD